MFLGDCQKLIFVWFELMKSKSYLITSENYKSIKTFMTGFIIFDGTYISSSQSLALFTDMKGVIPLFNEGRYFICINNGKTLDIMVDPMGQDIIYKYEVDGRWAVSNSYQALLEYLKSIKVKVTFSKVVSSAFLLPGGHGNQLLSNSTMCNQIKILGISKKISISLKDGSLKIIDKSRKYNEVSLYSKDGLKRLNRFISIWGSFISSLLDRSDFIVCDITGGRDSRVVLGLIILSGVDLKKIKFISNQSQKEDFHVAEILAKEYGFNLNDVERPKSKFFNITPEVKYDLWKKGSLGVYTPVYFCGARVFEQTYHFHGGGGELYRKIYKKSFCDQSDFFEANLKNLNFFDVGLLDEFLEGIVASGSGIDDPEALDKHYFNFRNRFHFGRGWYRDIGKSLISPLSSRTLYSLSRSSSFSSDEDRDILIAAILYKCSPKLIEIPFDKEDKEFSDYVKEEARKLASNIKVDFNDVKIYTEPGIDYSDLMNNKYSSLDCVVDLMKEDVLRSDVKEKFLTQYPIGIYDQALKDIDCDSLSVKDKCKGSSFVLSVSNVL